MPGYCYFCDANQKLVIVHHDVDTRLGTWGEVCYLNQLDPGETDPATPVRKLITAPAIIKSCGDSELRNLGFTKLVKRDEGVYENVTAVEGEKRYMRPDDPSSVPHIHRKVRD